MPVKSIYLSIYQISITFLSINYINNIAIVWKITMEK